MSRVLFRSSTAFASCLLACSPACSETLADAVALAYRSNPTLGISRYDLRVSDEGVAQARSELRPTASLNLTAGYTRTVYGRTSAAETSGPAAFGTNSNQADVVVDQPLYTGGRATADIRSAEATVQGSREALRGAEGDLLLAIITAYVDVRRYTMALDVWQQSVNSLSGLTREIGARERAGELTRTDSALAETQLATAREQLSETELDLETARADYAALVGHMPGVLAAEPALPRIPASADAAFGLAEDQNPELAQARATEVASRDAIESARSQGMPTIGLRASATLGGQIYPYSLRDQDQAYAGSVVVTVPLTAGGLVASRINEARDRNDGDRLRIVAERRQVAHSVQVAWNQVATAERQSRLLDGQRSSAAIQLDGMTKEYRVGLRSTFDVVYAQQTLRDTDIALLQSKRDRYVAQATLLRQTGLLEARALMTGVPLYDPAAHLAKAAGRNALPWEHAVSAIDRLGTPRAGQKPMRQPAAATSPAFVPAPGGTPVGVPPLSRNMPTADTPAGDRPTFSDRTTD